MMTCGNTWVRRLKDGGPLVCQAPVGSQHVHTDQGLIWGGDADWIDDDAQAWTADQGIAHGPLSAIDLWIIDYIAWWDDHV